MGVGGLKIAVVGGGVSGLAKAYREKKKGNNVTLFEASSCIGGKIATIYSSGYELDLGPVTISETPSLAQLIDEMKLEVIEASPLSSIRYIYSKGRLHNVSRIATGSLLSTGGKLSMLKAMFAGKEPREETVCSYATRRFGTQAYQRLFNPMMNGIYAGNAELLGARSVIKKRTPRKIISLKGGIAALTKSLAAKLGDSIKTNTAINNLRDLDQFDLIHLATPAFVTSNLIKDLDPQLASALNSIRYSNVTQIYCEVVPGEKKFDGFGFLVPSEERMSLLGAVCISNILPSKAPDGNMLFVLFCGGDRPYDFTSAASDAVAEFNFILQPAFKKVLHIQEWNNAIPQFYVGHERIVDRLKSFDRRISFGGNYVTGVAVGDCV